MTLLLSAVSLTRAVEIGWSAILRAPSRSMPARHQVCPLLRTRNATARAHARNAWIALPLSVVSFQRAPAIAWLIPSDPAAARPKTSAARPPGGRTRARPRGLRRRCNERASPVHCLVSASPHVEPPNLSSSTAQTPSVKVRAQDIRGGKIGQRKAVFAAGPWLNPAFARSHLSREKPHDNTRSRRYCHARSGRCVLGPDGTPWQSLEASSWDRIGSNTLRQWTDLAPRVTVAMGRYRSCSPRSLSRARVSRKWGRTYGRTEDALHRAARNLRKQEPKPRCEQDGPLDHRRG